MLSCVLFVHDSLCQSIFMDSWFVGTTRTTQTRCCIEVGCQGFDWNGQRQDYIGGLDAQFEIYADGFYIR